jgi:fermentation-respiration switch protein FrsA (DUF1100 family)
MAKILDRPEVTRLLFHPRRDYLISFSTVENRLIDIPVEPGITLGGRLYPAQRESPLLIIFHGNGEIAADYDDIASLYTQAGITLLVMDYRGYGRSTGHPLSSTLLTDAVTVYKSVDQVLKENKLSPAGLYVLGRSLGSAPAIEIARLAGGGLAGLIIESGFADTFALMARLGLRIKGVKEDRDGFGNLTKMGEVTIRTLVIHGEVDDLIPVKNGRQLYERCAAREKRLTIIPNAGHNDLLMVGLDQYMVAIRNLILSPVS